MEVNPSAVWQQYAEIITVILIVAALLYVVVAVIREVRWLIYRR